jgi:DNA invertase Pin-like site-specific DNA recombinase
MERMGEMTGAMEVVLYARVSSSYRGNPLKDVRKENERKQREQDVDNQLVILREYCRKQDWTIIGEYVDRKSGSKSDNREEFQRMLKDAHLHKFDLVLFWSLDRFSREGVLETLQHLQKLDHYKVGWKSYTEQYLDSLGVFKEAVLAILATIAKQERIRIVERVQAGLDRARAKGKVLGREKLPITNAQVMKMRKEGLSVREMATRLKCNKMTISRRLKEIEGA